MIFCKQVIAQNFKAHIIAGVSTSQVSGDNLSGFHKAGVLMGGGLSLNAMKSGAIAIEILFVQKGSQQSEDFTKGKQFYQMSLNYAEVPLLYKFRMRNFTYEIGASFGSLISSRVRDIYGVFPNGSIESRPFNKFETSALFGLSYKIYNRFYANYRFTNSVLPIRKHYSGLTYRLNRGQYNTAMYFALRYEFE
jgi:hypothetical protein